MEEQKYLQYFANILQNFEFNQCYYKIVHTHNAVKFPCGICVKALRESAFFDAFRCASFSPQGQQQLAYKWLLVVKYHRSLSSCSYPSNGGEMTARVERLAEAREKRDGKTLNGALQTPSRVRDEECLGIYRFPPPIPRFHLGRFPHTSPLR